MSGKAKSRSPLLLVDQLDDAVQVTFVQEGCRLVAQGKTLDEARQALEGRIAVFKALHAFVKSELKYRVVAREDLVDFVQRCVKLHLRQQYPMIRLHQVKTEMKAVAKLEGDRLALKYDPIVTKIFNLFTRSSSSG